LFCTGPGEPTPTETCSQRHTECCCSNRTASFSSSSCSAKSFRQCSQISLGSLTGLGRNKLGKYRANSSLQRVHRQHGNFTEARQQRSQENHAPPRSPSFLRNTPRFVRLAADNIRYNHLGQTLYRRKSLGSGLRIR